MWLSLSVPYRTFFHARTQSDAADFSCDTLRAFFTLLKTGVVLKIKHDEAIRLACKQNGVIIEEHTSTTIVSEGELFGLTPDWLSFLAPHHWLNRRPPHEASEVVTVNNRRICSCKVSVLHQ